MYKAFQDALHNTVQSVASAAQAAQLSMLTNDIAGIENYLNMIGGIIERQIHAPEKKKEFLNSIHLITERKANPNLNLAVLGQFSSGKSTFINAILRHELLKAKNAVSTAAATFIKKGDPISVKVTFARNYTIVASDNEKAELEHHLEVFHYSSLNDRRDLAYFIELLTTDKEIAATVTHLEIVYPANNLFLDDITIIDTPGLFAGADHTDSHESITQAVIDHSADLAIILLPAHQAVSASLVDFLETLPLYLLNRCVFILSRMDMIDNDERVELITATETQLKVSLGLTDLQLFTCSAMSIFPGASRVIQDKDEIDYWNLSFIILENALKEMMAQNKLHIIFEKLKFLMENLLRETGKELVVEESKLLEEAAKINSQAVVSIEPKLKSLVNNARTEIRNKEKQILNAIDFSQQLSSTKNSAASKITRAGGNIYDNYGSIESQLHGEIRDSLRTITSNVNRKIEEINELCEKHSRKFEQQFKANYASFEYLGRSITVELVQAGSLNFPTFNFSSYKRTLEKQNEDAKTGRNTGAIIGGVIGSLGGPIGAGIGAWLGSKIGKGMATDPLEELQAKVTGQLNEEIEACYNGSIQIIEQEITKITDYAIDKFEMLSQNHISAYGKDIQVLVDRHTQKSDAIQVKIDSANRDKLLLAAMMENLNKS